MICISTLYVLLSAYRYNLCQYSVRSAPPTPTSVLSGTLLCVRLRLEIRQIYLSTSDSDFVWYAFCISDSVYDSVCFSSALLGLVMVLSDIFLFACDVDRWILGRGICVYVMLPLDT